MNKYIKKYMNEWYDLVYPKKENLYKRKLIVEKVRHNINIFPFTRAITASLINDSLVPVRPLEAPTGTLFFMDYNDNSNARMLLIERRRRRKRGNEGRKIYR